jgi:hypothetical protein
MTFSIDIVTNIFVTFLWLIPAIIQYRSGFVLKYFFLIIAFTDIIAFLLVLTKVYNQNTLYVVSYLFLISTIINPESKITLIKHSFIKMYIFMLLVLGLHIAYTFLFPNILISGLVNLILSITICFLLFLATKHNLKYHLKLNWFIFMIFGLMFLNIGTFSLRYFGHIVSARFHNLTDILFILYFSFSTYNEPLKLFKKSF